MNAPVLFQELRHVRTLFAALYGAEADRCTQRFAMLLGRYGVGVPAPEPPCAWTARDAVLIAYGDSILDDHAKPLEALDAFLGERTGTAFTALHLLPFFPYSSDDGFSVVHFRHVNPALGDWIHVVALARRYRLMADLVLNHVSRLSGWMLDFEQGVAPGRDYILTGDPAADLSAVSRPRTHPLLTPVPTRDGERQVWTTFSADQVDLDYRNPDVLFEMLDILLFYVSQGVRLVRLDAVAYLWKDAGTACLHRPGAHAVVKICRALLDIVAPSVQLLTETNVPHAENVAYYGSGDEAHMVYQFSLPPLLLHALLTGSAAHLTAWAAALAPPPPGCAFLNFTASHDGIGLRPLQGLLPEREIERLAAHVQAAGGQVSARRNPDGSESPYELNATWFSALRLAADPSDERAVRRLLCSQAVALALAGVPALYIQTLLATPNDNEGFAATGRARSLNRRKWRVADLRHALETAGTTAAQALDGCLHLLRVRATLPAFDPAVPQAVPQLDDRVFAIVRTPSGSPPLLALANVSEETVTLPALPAPWRLPLRDHLAAGDVDGTRPFALAPYGVAWLTPTTG